MSFHAHLDLPADGTLQGAWALVRGWVVGPTDPGDMVLFLDGHPAPTARNYRPDVVAAFPDRAFVTGIEATLDLAWAAGLSPRALAPAGTRHRLEVRRGTRVLGSWPVVLAFEPAPARRVGLFVLGAAKCGTSSVWELLAGHPDICMSVPKEPYFFEVEHALGPSYYWGKYFGHWKGQPLCGEARVLNLLFPFVAARIHAYNPAARLVALLRHPIERLVSQWRFFHRSGFSPRPLAELLERDLASPPPDDLDWEAVARAAYERLERTGRHPDGSGLPLGDYAPQLRRYLDLFPRSQLLVVEFDELLAEPRATAARIMEFAGVDPRRHPTGDLPLSNEGASSPHPAEAEWKALKTELAAQRVARAHERRHPLFLPPALLETVRAWHRPRVAELEALLGRRFAWDLG